MQKMHRNGVMMTDNKKLTERQEQILTMAVTGMTNQEIADKLELANSTVGNTLRRIYEIIGIGMDTPSNRRVQAVLWAVENGVISVPPVLGEGE